MAEIFAREGSNAWFSRPAAELLPPRTGCPRCDGHDFEKLGDIVDVWFESGVSWAAVADGKLVPSGDKVDLYLEGADQHRGWFHSSLLTSTATRNQAPYKAVLTHGWVLDERGKVYSKSEIARARAAGAKIDYIDPGVWMEKNGAELLRLWTAASDYQGDVVFSPTIFDQLSESYRKIRNTCRFLLSNLYDFVPSRDRLEDFELREIDLLALGVLRERDHQIFEAYRRFSFHEVVRLHQRLRHHRLRRGARSHQGHPLLRGDGQPAPAERSDHALRDDPHASRPGWRRSSASPPRTWRTSCRAPPASRSMFTRACVRRSAPGTRHGPAEPPLDRRNPPATGGDSAAARALPGRRAQVARGARAGDPNGGGATALAVDPRSFTRALRGVAGRARPDRRGRRNHHHRRRGAGTDLPALLAAYGRVRGAIGA